MVFRFWNCGGDLAGVDRSGRGYNPRPARSGASRDAFPSGAWERQDRGDFLFKFLLGKLTDWGGSGIEFASPHFFERGIQSSTPTFDREEAPASVRISRQASRLRCRGVGRALASTGGRGLSESAGSGFERGGGGAGGVCDAAGKSESECRREDSRRFARNADSETERQGAFGRVRFRAAFGCAQGGERR